jgi:diguanylate cyclase (GGDEF)-like protein
VLQVIAQRLQSTLRSGDTVSRRSGDEFLILLLETTGAAAVAALAARIVTRLAEPCEVAGVTLAVTVSIGVAMSPDDGQSVAALLGNADMAMYAAKKGNRGALLYGALGPPKA